MAVVFRLVPREAHRSQHEAGDGSFFRFPAQPFDEPLEVRRRDCIGRRRETVAERGCELLERLHLGRVGALVHAKQCRHLLPDEVFRHRLVRDEHELLDDPVGRGALIGDDRRDTAGVVASKTGDRHVEVDGSAPPPALRENRGQRPRRDEEGRDVRVLPPRR